MFPRTSEISIFKNRNCNCNCKCNKMSKMFPSHPKCSPGTPAVPALFSCLGQGVIFYQIKKAVQFLDLADLKNVFKVWYAGNTSFICKNKLWPTGPPGGPEIWPMPKLTPDSYFTQKIVIVLNLLFLKLL